ncbi:MAG: aspartate carbamoyltransferase regulatory subunit [Candidatus Micrarchaeota archaeon]
MQIDVIEKGTVVDHIKAGKGPRVLRILGVDENYPEIVALVMNAVSKKSGKKDIVKIAEKQVDDKAANTIALISPGATINIIEGQKVSKKFEVQLPEELNGVGRCPNPNCMTSVEECMQMFAKEGEDTYRCHYCERLFKAEELV